MQPSKYQSSKFWLKNWVEIKDKRRTHNTNSQIKLCVYDDVYLFVKWIISVTNTAAAGNAGNNNNKKVVFKNCAPWTDTDVDNRKEIDAVLPMFNLIEYNNNYVKTSGKHYCKEEPCLNDSINRLNR